MAAADEGVAPEALNGEEGAAHRGLEVSLVLRGGDLCVDGEGSAVRAATDGDNDLCVALPE